MINAFSLAGLLLASSSLGVGLLVFFKSGDRQMARIWVIFSSAIVCWGIGIFWVGYAKELSQSLLAWRFMYVFGVIWIAPLYYHFVCTFLGQPKPRITITNYTIALVFLLAFPSPYFFRRLDFLFGQFFYVRGGFLYNIFFFWWSLVVVVGHFDLMRALKHVSQPKKTQIQYFFLATAIGFTGGFHTYLPKIGIDVYPWGIFAVFLYPLIMSYAMARHRLMDVRLFIRRAALLVAVYLGLIFVGSILVFLSHHHQFGFHQEFTGSLIFEVLILSVILSLGPFLYAYLIKRSSYFHEHEMAGMTHDLKSPLENIQSALEMLENLSTGAMVQERDADYLNMINRNTARLEESINNLLTIFKIPTKADAFQFKIKDLNQIVTMLIPDFREAAQSKGIILELTIPASPTMIRCDESKLQQVIANLMLNALKYTKQGRVTVAIEPREKDVCVSVTDTGEGIAANELPRIFDRLFQGETSRKLKGSGLGLTIAKTWVEAHGGEIHAESDGEGKGSRFWFTLPK